MWLPLHTKSIIYAAGERLLKYVLPLYLPWLSIGSEEGGFQTLSSNPQLFFLSSFQNWDLSTIWDSKEASNGQSKERFHC